jgi:Na+/melibiose symporter-like transporter
VGNTANIGNGDIFTNFVYGAAMEMVVVFSIPLLLNNIGRRWTLIGMLTIAMTASFLFAFLSPGNCFLNTCWPALCVVINYIWSYTYNIPNVLS